MPSFQLARVIGNDCFVSPLGLPVLRLRFFVSSIRISQPKLAKCGHSNENHLANKWLIYLASIKVTHCCIYHTTEHLTESKKLGACFCSELTTRHERPWVSTALFWKI